MARIGFSSLFGAIDYNKVTDQKWLNLPQILGNLEERTIGQGVLMVCEK
jgi:hypothetical protein